MAGNAVAKKDKVMTLIESLKPAMQNALPKHLTADRMMRIVLTECRKNPKLMQCDQKSLAGAIITASQLGLEPGVNGQCWLIPYGKEATFIPGYQGLIELAYRSGLIEAINAHAVYENDDFAYDLGNNTVRHIPTETARGKLTHAYAWAKIKGSSEKIYKVLSRVDVEAIKKSSKSASSSSSPWKQWEAEMWVKSAIKRLMKMLPKSSSINIALQADDRAEMLDVSASVIDTSPLDAGEHDFSEKKPPKSKPEPDVVAPPTDIYDMFAKLYDKAPDAVDAALEEAGMASLMTLTRKDVSADDAAAWENAKDIYIKANG